MVNKLRVDTPDLVGRTTGDGWNIKRKLPTNRSTGGTGGTFSVGYIVENLDGRQGFLKALDISNLLLTPNIDPVRMWQYCLESFNFERDLLALCQQRRCNRVVTAISEGRLEVEGFFPPFAQYIVFELASGDIRGQMGNISKLQSSWYIRVMHHVAVGLHQLHMMHVCHQDTKPSNILIFDKEISKVADLGRALSLNHVAPHDGEPIPGDKTYAAPELRYNYFLPDRFERSRAVDMFHLGSLLNFLVTGVPITPQLISKLHPEHRPSSWTGTYLDVLPYLQESFGRIVSEFRTAVTDQLPNVQQSVVDEISAALVQLCEPDVRRRGHPRNRAQGSGSPFSLERYVSTFNRLATHVEFLVKVR